MLRERQRSMEEESAFHDKREVEMKHKLYELQKQMQTLQLEKERQLRHLEEDFLVRQNELWKEIEQKDMILSEEEERQARQLVEREKMYLEETNGKKLFELQTEKDELQRAIDF